MTNADNTTSPDSPFKPYASVVPAGQPDKVHFYRRRLLGTLKMALIKEWDIRETLVLTGALGITGLLGPPAWVRYNEVVAKLRLAKHMRKNFDRYRTAVEAVLGPKDHHQMKRLFIASRVHYHRRRISQGLEMAGGKQRPELEVRGVARLKSALARGKGALLWADPFSAQTIIGKRAIWEAGFRPIQVSTDGHGSFRSNFGAATLARSLAAVENQYLARRIAFKFDEGQSVTRQILRALADGGLVIVTNNTYSGSSFMEMPLGPSGFVSMGTAIPGIAVRHDVPIFSMSTLEVEPFTHFRVHLSDPLAPLPTQAMSAPDRDREREAIARTALAARDHLLRGVRAAPEQYLNMLGADRSPLDYDGRHQGGT